MEDTQRREDPKNSLQFGGGRSSNAQAKSFAGVCVAAAVSLACLFFTGCATTGVTPDLENPNVQIRMSKKVSLEAKEPAERTVLLDFDYCGTKNLRSGLSRGLSRLGIELTPIEESIEASIRRRLKAKGYQMTTSPAEAYYILKVNVRVARITSWQGRVIDVVVLTAKAAIIAGTGDNIATIDDSDVGAYDRANEQNPKHKGTVQMVTDLEIVERTREKVAQTGRSNKSANRTKKYRTKIVSTATKVTFQEGCDLLGQELAASIADIF